MSNRVEEYLTGIANGERTDLTPHTREEIYLAAVAGEYDGELPEPCTVKEFLLKQIAEGAGKDGPDVEMFVVEWNNVTGGAHPKKIVIDGSRVAVGLTRGMTLLESVELKVCPEDGRLPLDMFSSSSSLKEIMLPDGLVSIGAYCFSYCTSLLSLDLKSVQTIENHALQYCRAMKSVAMKRVSKIDYNAFKGCSGLASVEIGSAGNAVTSIGSGAFGSCTALTDITVYVDDPVAGLENSPWGASNATVTYKQA